MRVLSWAYSKCINNYHNEYVRYTLDECVILTQAWNKWTDKVVFESRDKKTGSPVVVQVDLNNMAQTTSASDFKAVRGVIIIQDDEMSAVADRSVERFALRID